MEFDSDRTHVSRNLLYRLLERKKERFLPAAASGTDQTGRYAGLAGARRAREQDSAATIESLSVEHLVERGNTARNSFGGRSVTERKGSHWKNGKARFADQERIFVGAMRGPTVLGDTKPASQNRI